MGDGAAGVANRCDRHFFGVVSPILAPVDNFALPDSSRKNRLPKILIIGGILAIGLQKPRVLADRFLDGVSGYPGEGGVDVLNGGRGIGNYDGFADLSNRRGEKGDATPERQFWPTSLAITPAGSRAPSTSRGRRSVAGGFEATSSFLVPIGVPT